MLNRQFHDCNESDFEFAGRAVAGSLVIYSVVFSPRSASIIKYTQLYDDTEQYGEVLVCFSVKERIYVIIKKFHIVMRNNILEVSPPQNSILLPLYNDRVYGSFFCIIRKSEELAIVEITDIRNVAILIDGPDVSTVTDVLPFEHD